MAVLVPVNNYHHQHQNQQPSSSSPTISKSSSNQYITLPSNVVCSVKSAANLKTSTSVQCLDKKTDLDLNKRRTESDGSSSEDNSSTVSMM